MNLMVMLDWEREGAEESQARGLYLNTEGWEAGSSIVRLSALGISPASGRKIH